MNMKHTKHIIPIALGLIIALLLFGTFRMCHKPDTVTVTDTVTVERTDTLYDTATLIHFCPKPVYDTIIRWDTVRKDTPIPYVQKTYSDTVTNDDGASVEYFATVSGHDPSLDTIRFNLNYPVITNTVTNTVTETKYVTKKQSHFSLGPTAGVGYGMTTKQFDAWVGLGLTYRF